MLWDLNTSWGKELSVGGAQEEGPWGKWDVEAAQSTEAMHKPLLQLPWPPVPFPFRCLANRAMRKCLAPLGT